MIYYKRCVFKDEITFIGLALEALNAFKFAGFRAKWSIKANNHLITLGAIQIVRVL